MGKGCLVSEHWIQTFTDKAFDFLEIKSSVICIQDIAHALAYQCRYNGHCRQFYSVAEHSVRASVLLENKNYTTDIVAAALLHDAHEAYLGDVVAPLKTLAAINEGFQNLADAIDAAIGEHFLIPPHLFKHFGVVWADHTLLATELRDLFGDLARNFSVPGVTALDTKIVPVSPDQAEALFLERFKAVFSSRSHELLVRWGLGEKVSGK